ncbi:MAG: putative serine/threonine-protein kinase iks1 [Cirrosporium novae-zelandiae]|nr:MAG: putative serine/threonine-protein kinase iks1 [Cirrosporium novae-zelandiae]
MADEEHHRSMSIVRYSPSEIVLRHNDSIVLYDPSSRQLVLRNHARTQDLELADCPYCHRPMRPESSERTRTHQAPTSDTHGGFVNPEYFRLLHHSSATSVAGSRPPSPRRQLAQSLGGEEGFDVHPSQDAEFVGSAPSAAAGVGISSASLSQGYFNRFFEEEKELGRGGKGVVLLVRHVLDGVNLGHFACKRVPVGDNHEWLEKVLIEVQLLQHLSHKNLVAYHHVWLEDVKLNNFGPSVPCAFILQKYCNAGDLHNYVCGSIPDMTTSQLLKEQMRRRSRAQLEPVSNLRRGRKLGFEQIYSFFKDITSGLNHLHQNGYIHRDLKPQNCLLHDSGKELRVLVSDFGEVQVQDMARKSTGTTGTISYCAPEVLRRDSNGALGNFTTKSDIFSLGMILYFICFGELPYHNADNVEENEDLDLLRAEISTWAGFVDERRKRIDLPDKLYTFLRRLLSLDPAKRPTAEEVLSAIRTGAGLGEAKSSRITAVETPPRKQQSVSTSPRRGNAASTSVSHHRLSQSALSRTRRPPILHPASGSSENPDPTPSTSSDTSEPTYLSDSTLILHHHSPLQSPTTGRLERPLLPPPPPRSNLASIIPFLFPFTTHRIHSPLLGLSIRTILLILKVISFTQPCAPRATNPAVLYPLLCLAATDFGMGALGAIGSIFSLLLLIIHIMVVGVVVRTERLCVRGPILPWSPSGPPLVL